MKADIHPDYHEITVVMVDGTEYKTRSTYGKEGDVIRLEIDPTTHPAWTGGADRVVEKGQLDKFESRYGSFGISAPPKGEPAPKKEAKAEAEEAPAKKAAPAEESVAEEAPAEEAPAEDEAPAEETATEEENSEESEEETPKE